MSKPGTGCVLLGISQWRRKGVQSSAACGRGWGLYVGVGGGTSFAG